MSQNTSQWLRTYNCGELNRTHVGQQVTLNGWVASTRNHGTIQFLNLRDRFGLTQIFFDADYLQAYELAKTLRNEYVVAIRGTVRARPDNMRNTEMTTGEIEIMATELFLFNKCAELPFQIEDGKDISETLRMKYRYLDLRRKEVQSKILGRSKITRLIREAMEEEGFLDLETPFLYKSTPEGAREFLVPSRIHPNRFYALPQSPQLFKQLFMISGFDRYYQIVRCFRDEDLRADRQPEFTQLDCELSFIDQEMVLSVFTRVTRRVANEFVGRAVIGETIPRMTFKQAMDEYGCDKPDVRFELRLQELTALLGKSSFTHFQETASKGGIINALVVNDQERVYSRKKLDELAATAATFSIDRLYSARVQEGGTWESSLSKSFTEDEQKQISRQLQAKTDDLLLFAAGPYDKVKSALSAVRQLVGRELKLYNPADFAFLWVVDFPLLEFHPEAQRWLARHHPFCRPNDADLHLLESDPGAVRAYAYDLVCNGYELGGGSIRIHREELQSRVFSAIGLSEVEARQKFGFLLDALQFGAPPHGGIAFGLDRLVMILTQCDAIRDCIPFPKTNKAVCLMTEAPTPVPETALRDLHLTMLPPA